MNPFAAEDHEKLLAPAETFDEDALRQSHGPWGGQLLRNCLALEVLAQLRERTDDLLFKGGTLLQSRLAWPPLRASVDVDVDASDAANIRQAVEDFERTFSASGLEVRYRDSALPGFKADIIFHAAGPVGYALRLDVLEYDEWPRHRGAWRLPAPWGDRPPVQAPSMETQAAQKLLMGAEAPYGRNLDADLGRKSFIKDLYDLRALGFEHLDSNAILEAAHEDVLRKSAYMQTGHEVAQLVEQAAARSRLLAPRRPTHDARVSPVWRAYSSVRRTIRDGFTELDLRVTAGCVHHALLGIANDDLDWPDAWNPAIHGTRRQAWTEGHELVCHPEIADDLEDAVGLHEAWALHQSSGSRAKGRGASDG